MTRKWKIAACSAVLLASAGVAYRVGLVALREADPTTAFSTLTGAPVPAGVRVIEYASATSDNFFRVTHYWLVEGDGDSLRKIAEGAGFSRSDADAAQILSQAAAHFGLVLGPSELAEGYESDHSRNRWLLILKGQRSAIYVL